MTTLESDKIASLLVWEGERAIDYSADEICCHGLTTIYGIICDRYADDVEVNLYDADAEFIDCVTVGDLREFLE